MNLTIFAEVVQSLDAINEEHQRLQLEIKNMMKQYHIYHVLNEKCQEICVRNPHTYFETLHHSIKSLNLDCAQH